MSMERGGMRKESSENNISSTTTSKYQFLHINWQLRQAGAPTMLWRWDKCFNEIILIYFIKMPRLQKYLIWHKCIKKLQENFWLVSESHFAPSISCFLIFCQYVNSFLTVFINWKSNIELVMWKTWIWLHLSYHLWSQKNFMHFISKFLFHCLNRKFCNLLGSTSGSLYSWSSLLMPPSWIWTKPKPPDL